MNWETFFVSVTYLKAVVGFLFETAAVNPSAHHVYLYSLADILSHITGNTQWCKINKCCKLWFYILEMDHLNSHQMKH